MIDGSEKRNRQLAFELQNSHVCEKRSKLNGDTVPTRKTVYISSQAFKAGVDPFDDFE